MTNILSLNEGKIRIQYDPDDIPAFYRISALPEKQMQEPGIVFAPYSSEVFEQLQKWKFIPSNELIEFSRKERTRKEKFQVNGMNGELRPFQNKGVRFMDDANGRCLLSDDMGLGKTLQSIGYIHIIQKFPVVVICPASIKINWQREIEKWTGRQSEILSGKKPYKTEGDILIINYDIASFWTDEIKRRKPQILILDELTRIKTARTNRTKAIFRLKNIPHIIGLSGTPIENRPSEIYNAGKLIRPDLFGTFAEFKRKYCNGNGFGSEFNGTEHTHLLHFFLTSTGFMLRRLKKDVLTELPEKTFSFVPMELNNWREYKEAENNFVAWLKREKGVEVTKQVEALAKFENLKQLATKGKLRQVKEWISDFLETGNKLVVFCTHTFVVDELMAEFKDVAVKIVGGTSDRQTPVDRFQNDPETRLFIGNVIAAGEGITLTSASNVAMIELPWSPSKVDQCADRCHRIGQKENVMLYYLLAQNTVEERIAKLLDKKRKMVNSAMNGVETEKSELLVELINQYKN